jgi:hypothetical protein
MTNHTYTFCKKQLQPPRGGRRRTHVVPTMTKFNFIQEKIDEMNLDWEPDAETQEVIDFYEDIIANKDGDVRYRDVIFAEKQLAAIKAELAKPKAHFYDLSTLDKLEWLLDHPRYAAQAERIDQRAAGRRKRTQPDERERVPEFESLQFQQVEDMTVLIELRNYLLKVTGAITDVHVQAWRRRRMCLGENPLEVFAKVKDEALCIQAAGVLNFQADRELYALLTRKHTEGGAFFGNTLWGRVRDKVEQAVEARGYLQNSPDMYMEIATIWATKAHAVFIDAPATDLSFHLEIQADLKARGKPPTWATTDRAAVPTGAVKQDAQPSGSGAKAQDGKAGGKQDHKQKYYCDHCKKPGHSTDRCHALRALGQQAAAQQLALPAPPPCGHHRYAQYPSGRQECCLEARLPLAQSDCSRRSARRTAPAASTGASQGQRTPVRDMHADQQQSGGPAFHQDRLRSGGFFEATSRVAEFSSAVGPC